MKRLFSSGWLSLGRLSSGWRWAAFLTAGICLCGPDSQGAVFSRDWKTPGDGLLTYDNVNQREWLDLSQTTLPVLPGSTVAAKLQYVIAQTTNGGLFDGFGVAKKEDVFALAASAGIDTARPFSDDNYDAASALIGLLSPTNPIPSVSSYSIGYLDSFELFGHPQPVLARLTVIIVVSPPRTSGLYTSVADDFLFSNTQGVMLYRTAVPEPCCLTQLLMVITLQSLTTFRGANKTTDSCRRSA